MNEQTVVEKKRNGPPRGAGAAKKTRRFTPDERLKAVRLYLEEGFSLALVIGIMIGTYSSIAIAAPILVAYQEWRGERRSTE